MPQEEKQRRVDEKLTKRDFAILLLCIAVGMVVFPALYIILEGS